METEIANLSIIIPIKNEGINIQHVLEGLITELGDSTEIIVCYDDENDTSIEYLNAYKEKLSNLILVKNNFELGYIGAIKAGIKKSSKKAILIFNGDLADDAKDIKKMHELYKNGAEVVTASRHTQKGNFIGGNKIKIALSKIANSSFKTLSGTEISDITNSFKLYDSEFLKAVEIESKKNFELAMELTIKAFLKNKIIKEIPTTWTDRNIGKSNFNFFKINGYIHWYVWGIINIWKLKICK